MPLDIHESETRRMEALRRYRILDTPPDGNFDGITSLAAKLLKVPVALTTLVDTDRIWFKSRHGVEIEQIPRDPGLCASAIMDGVPYLVENARYDPRTLSNPLVAGDFGLQFYLAVPLSTQDNHRLGTLCVLDTEPRTATREDVEILTTLAGLIMDQMELRLASRRIEEKNASLAELNIEKDHFIAMAAHDLRNPLGNILMLGSLLAEENVGPLNPAQAEMISSVCQSSEFMARQVDDFLEFSMLGTRQIRLERIKADLSALCGSCMTDQQHHALAKQIRVSLDAPAGLPEISLDSTRIRRALGNLIGNAIKFSRAGDSVQVRIRQEPGCLRVEVADQGPGIPSDEISSLFQPYSVSSVTPIGGEKSTGLGLSIAKRIIEAHGGQIGVESTPGQGSTFFTILPILSSAPSPHAITGDPDLLP